MDQAGLSLGASVITYNEHIWQSYLRSPKHSELFHIYITAVHCGVEGPYVLPALMLGNFYTVFDVQSIVVSVHCALCTLCTLFTAHCVQCSVCNIQCNMCSVTLHTLNSSITCNVCSVQCSVFSVQCLLLSV